MGINLFNFENIIVDNEKLSMFLALLIIFVGILKIYEFVVNRIEIKEKFGIKSLKIKKYKIEVLNKSVLSCIVMSIINYIIFYYGIELYNLQNDIVNKILYSGVLIEILTLSNLFCILISNTIIRKYDSSKIINIARISIIILIQYLILLLLIIVLIFKLKFNIAYIFDIWKSIWLISFILYFFQRLFYSLFGKANLTAYSDKIEIIIEKNYYNDIYIEKIIINGLIKSEKDNVLLLNNDGNKFRTINREWIEQINVLREDGAVKTIIKRKDLNNTLINYNVTVERKFKLKRILKASS